MGEISTGNNQLADPTTVRDLLAKGFAVLRRRTIPALLILAVLYGSLIPFRFDFGRLSLPDLAGSFMRFRDTTLEDISVNVFAYAILAAALFRSSRHRLILDGVVIVVLCSVLSLATETLQVFMPQRVSSATDCLLNAIGAALGVIGCALMLSSRKKFAHVLALEMHQRPLGLCVITMSSALLAYDLVPFDFITSTQQLHESLARIQLFHFPCGLAAITGELSGAAWFAVLGYLMTRDALGRGRSVPHSLRSGVQHGLILACLIECLQLFTKSHVPEVAVGIIRGLGAFFGAWTAAFITSHSRIQTETRESHPISTSFLFAAATVQLLFLGLTLFPNLRNASTPSTFPELSLPFQSLWLQPAPLAGAHALSTIVPACLLAATLAAAFRRAGVPMFRAVSSLTVIGCYLGFEFLSATFGHKPFDSTNTILSVMACGFALRGERWLASLDGMDALRLSYGNDPKDA